MVVSDAINNIMGGMESTAGVRLHNHRRKLRQRFDIIKKLGQGTYGKVQLGINKETGQEVAIKTIKKSKIETEADLVRIRREIQIMSSVQHPNIIHIYEVFENREKMVLVMEYAAGGELYDFLSERKVLAEAEARRIFRQIATAVFYCHKHNICHRDLKLENILLDEHGAAKIADFGLSNVFDEHRLLATFCGSPLYASPEIVRGTPYRGPEVDCWSLGVLLYTLVYGAMPFDGSNFKRLVKQISNGEYFEPKKPSPASGLIRAMLCVDPATRADISAVCSDAWINEGSGHTCFELAEELAAQTPVRLDLLLSLAPATAAPAGTEATPAEPLARSQSVGALMELDKTLALAQPARRRSSAAGQEPGGKDAVTAAKRKLEEGSSTDEASSSGAKRKERTSRRRDRSAERTGERKTRSASRTKQPKPKAEEPVATAPVTNEIPPESPMDIDVEAKPEVKVVSEVKEDKSVEPSSKVETTSEVTTEEVKVTDDAKKVKVKRKKKVTEDSGSKEDVSVSESSQIVEKPKETVAAKEAEAVDVKTETTEKTENVEEAKVAKSTEPEKPKAIKKTGSIKKKAEPTKPVEEEVAKPMARRRSKIFESEIQKFNNPEPKSPVVEKPKKVFIPGVKVSDFKKAYERKSSVDLSAAAAAAAAVPNLKTSQSKTAMEKTESEMKEPVEPVTAGPVSAEPVAEPTPAQKPPSPAHVEPAPAQPEPVVEKPVPADLAKLKKNAIEIIGNAIAKPPKPLDALKMKPRSPPESPRSEMNKVLESLKTPDRRHEDASGKKMVKVQVGPNDVRNAVLQVSTPELVENFKFEERDRKPAEPQQVAGKEEPADRPKVSTKVEITLKSATLPRRKTSKAEIRLESPPAPPKPEFRTQVQHVVQAVGPKLPTQRSEVAFPVAAAQTSHRSMSVEPESAIREKPRERIIPIQFAREPDDRPPLQSQRSNQSTRSSLSRQSTQDSDGGDSVPTGPEPIRKSPREFIIPIAVEGGGIITPRAASLEPGTAAPGAEPKRKPMRFARPLRMSSLLSESDDDCFSPFSPRDGAGIDDEFGAHMHQLRSSRASRFPAERADSVSSGEDDDDDNFELLTAESLFSTLLSRVRNLTQRLNTDDARPAFPTSRFMNHNFPSRSSFFSEPLSRRVSETSQFSRQSSRDRSCDRDSNHSSSTLRSGNSNSTLPRSGNSNSTLPRSGNSNASLPRAQSRTDSSSSIYTPSLSRRLLANQEPSLPRNSSHSSLPTTRATPRPVSRTGSLKSSENKSRLPTSFLHRSGSESFEGNEGKASFNESPSRGYDNARLYESPTKSTESQRPYDNSQRPYDNITRQYDNSPRPYENTTRPYDNSPRPYENITRQYDNYPMPYESRLPLPYERPEGEDVYGSWSSLHSGQYPRRNLVAGSTNSLPRRHTYRTSMSDSLDFSRPEEPRPPLPGRRLPRSSSYLRQRALDIANVYAAPIAADSDYTDRLAEFRARRSATPVRRAGSVSRETSAGERNSDAGEPAAEGSRRPTTLNLAPECSVLGKLLGDGRDETPTSPVRSPGRRVSRFLRPDFYDTAREDSAFVKVKAEEERARLNGGAGSRQLDVTNFLQSNYADMERDIAEGLRAIGENGILREKVGSVPVDKTGGSVSSPTKKASREKGNVQNGLPDLANNGGKNGGKDLTSPTVLTKTVDSLEDSVAKSVVVNNLEKCEPKENEAKRKLVTKEVGNGVEKLEGKVLQESKVKEGDSNVKPAPKTAEPRANAASDVEKNVTKHVPKDLSLKNKEPPKSLVKSEKVPSKEKTTESSDSKDNTKSEIVTGVEKTPKEKIGREGSIKLAESVKTLEKSEKIGVKEMSGKTAGNNSPVKEIPSPTAVVTKRVGNAAKADVSAAKSVCNSTENIQANSESNGSSLSNAVTKSLPSNDTSAVSSKEEMATKLPTKIKLKRKVKKDPESSPKEVTEEVKPKPSSTEEVKSKPKPASTEELKSKPKPETTNRSKFLRTLDKTIDKFEETVKRPGKIVRETSLAPPEAPSISALVKRAVSTDDCSSQSPEKSPNKIKRVIDSLKELAIAPKPTPDTENSLLKRATSVDDMTNPSQTKTNQVSSMLGRFRKLEEPKKTSLLSRFRKTQSVYGGSTSDGVLALDGDVGKRASLGPESFEGMNEASCSVIVRRNSVKKAEEKVDSDADVSISATVKVVKVVKDQESAASSKAKDESANGKKLSGTSQSNVDLKSSKQSLGLNAGNKRPDLSNDTKVTKLPEPTENGTGRKGELPNSSQTNGSASPSKLAYKKPTKPTDDTNPTRNGKNPSVGSPEIKVNVVGGQPTSEDQAHERNTLKVRDVSEECESLDSRSISSERTSPLLPRATSPRLDGPVESIEARIRRKSFYSRFNDSKKQPARKVSVPGLRNSGSSTAFDTDAM